MSRRKFREERSKFYGTKQVLQDLNQPAHLAAHDLDPTVAGIPAGGLAGQFLMKNSNDDYDVTWAFLDAFPAIVDNGDAINGPPYDLVIDGGDSFPDQVSSLDGGSATT